MDGEWGEKNIFNINLDLFAI